MKTNNNPHGSFPSSNDQWRQNSSTTRNGYRRNPRPGRLGKVGGRRRTTVHLGGTMKPVASILTGLSLAVLLLAAPAQAQYDGQKIISTIPFEFMIGNRSLPAGRYTFLRTGANAFLVRSADRFRRMSLRQRPSSGLPTWMDSACWFRSGRSRRPSAANSTTGTPM